MAVLILLCGMPTLPVAAQATTAQRSYLQGPSDQAQPLLAGLLVNGKDSGANITLLRRGDCYAADIDQFAAAIGTRVRTVGTQLHLATPLGDAVIAESTVIRRGDARYVPIAALGSATAARIDFDSQEFALRVDLPWSPGATAEATARSRVQAHETPDIRAPVASLSAIHSEAYLTRQSGTNAWSSFTDLQGALGPGSWRARILTAPGGRSAMQGYGWMLDRGNSRTYLGHDQVALDPLLPYANLTGVQYAWSTRPDLTFGNDLANNEIAASRMQGGQILSGGDAPPGGIAELRVDGKVVARTVIRLDGTWEFRGILLRSDAFAEVALYRRFGDGAPLRVEQISASTSPRSLPAGTVVSYAGLGLDGNPLDSSIPTHGVGGFYQMRWGVSDHLTVDGSVQRAGGRSYAATNAIFGLGAVGTWGVGLAHSGSANAWSVQGNGQRDGWFWNALALERGPNYFPGISDRQTDRYAEFGRHIDPRLDISLVGRDVHDPASGNNYRYLKPAFNWRPTDSFSISARPDYSGRYAYAANWAVRADTRLSVSRYAGISQVDLARTLPYGLQLDLAATRDPRLGTRYSQVLSGTWARSRPVIWSAGALEGNGRLGYLLDAAMEAIPGLSVHMQLYDDPINRGATGGPILQFSMVADFAVTPSGLARGSYSTQATRRGAISGKLIGELPQNVKLSDLAGVMVLVDGKPLGRLDGSGHYLVSDLAPGIYRLQLDSENLPIDLMPPEKRPLVEVRSGATTRADFAMQLRLGFAGRVTAVDGSPRAGLRVTATNAQGRIVATTQTDARGYYRLDQLPVSSYTVRAGPASRQVTIQRAFVYGQNLTVR